MLLIGFLFILKKYAYYIGKGKSVSQIIFSLKNFYVNVWSSLRQCFSTLCIGIINP